MTNHNIYAAALRSRFAFSISPHRSVPLPLKTTGPGTELTKLLSAFGITYTADCECKSRSATMDRNGWEWCEQNIDKIVGWLKEEADKRKLPFSRTIGKRIVRKAIRRARNSIAAAEGKA